MKKPAPAHTPDLADSAREPRRRAPALGSLAAVCGFAFVILAAIVTRGGLRDLDRATLLAMRDSYDPARIAGPDWFGPFMADVTALGGAPILTLLTIVLVGYLIVRRRWASIVLLVVVVLGQSLAVDAMKQAFDRARPDAVPHLVAVANKSFPSGHAASAASIYLYFAIMLSPSLPNRAARNYAMATAVLLALLIGMSRVALGVHYPSDVLAGWSFGVTWTAALTILARSAGLMRR